MKFYKYDSLMLKHYYSSSQAFSLRNLSKTINISRQPKIVFRKFLRLNKDLKSFELENKNKSLTVRGNPSKEKRQLSCRNARDEYH